MRADDLGLPAPRVLAPRKGQGMCKAATGMATTEHAIEGPSIPSIPCSDMFIMLGL